MCLLLGWISAQRSPALPMHTNSALSLSGLANSFQAVSNMPQNDYMDIKDVEADQEQDGATTWYDM